jgi:thiol-disulfide isomerase/thioredoxin
MHLDFRALAVPAIVATISTVALAQEQTLKVGSDAPELKIGRWVQGEVSDLSDPNRTYVVEFWATWCGPCKVSIPHLNKLHQRGRFGGLTIIGVSDESFATVKGFVSRKGATMSYPIAIDTEDKSMQNSWMKAANQNGIPCAFIVRGGKILWIGNPLDPEFDLILPLAMVGRYNPELIGKASPMLTAARDALKVRNFRDAMRHYDSIIELDPKVFGDVAVRKYEKMLSDVKDKPGARAWGEQMLQRFGGDPLTLAELSGTILYSDEIKDRDYELASKAVEAMSRTLPENNQLLLRVRASVLAAQGQYDEAQEFQYKLWMAAPSEYKADYKRQLDEYRKAAKTKGSAKASQPAGESNEGKTESSTEKPAEEAAP